MKNAKETRNIRCFVYGTENFLKKKQEKDKYSKGHAGLVIVITVDVSSEDV